MTKKKLPADIICECKAKCYPNPGGLMSYGFALYHPEDREPFFTDSGTKMDNIESTNYRAYFYAILIALDHLLNHGYSGKVIELKTDLRGAINQIIDWIYLDGGGVDFSLLYMQSDLLKKIIDAKNQFKKVRLVWVNKDEISLVDKLASQALTTFSGGASIDPY